jgi:pimeloyl-ACP methyl ester carboxylesterase
MATIEWADSVVSAAGIDLHMMRAGRGSPVLVLHRDIGTLARLPFYDTLAQTHDVIIPHHPGYGVTPRPDWLHDVRDVAVIYRALVGDLGLPQATLVGLGFGGWIAAEMATFAPADTPRLVLAGAMGIKPPHGNIMDQALISYIEYVRAGFHDQGCFARNYGEVLTTEQLVRWDLCREMSFRLAWKPYMYSDSLPHLLRGVRSSALVIWGDHDQVVPRSAGTVYVENLPDARLETISSAGHLIEMEQPDALAHSISSFIAST